MSDASNRRQPAHDRLTTPFNMNMPNDPLVIEARKANALSQQMLDEQKTNTAINLENNVLLKAMAAKQSKALDTIVGRMREGRAWVREYFFELSVAGSLALAALYHKELFDLFEIAKTIWHTEVWPMVRTNAIDAFTAAKEKWDAMRR